MLHTAKVSNKTTFVSLVQKFVEKIILQILPLKSIYLTVQVVPGLHWSRFTSSELTSLFKYIHKKKCSRLQHMFQGCVVSVLQRAVSDGRIFVNFWRKFYKVMDAHLTGTRVNQLGQPKD